MMNELTINLNPEKAAPLYEQIYEYIRKDIQRGQLTVGARLPSTRALAQYLEVSRSTVVLAYEQLLSEGYIESRPCKGFFVAEIEGLYQLSTKEVRFRTEPEKKETVEFDFSPSGVDLNSFPYSVWRKLSKEVLLDARAELFRVGDPQGEPGFRRAICTYLHQARGVVCTPEQVIVGAGSDCVLLILSLILGRDRVIAFEDPAYRQAYRLAKGMDYDTIPVEMDRQGMQVSKLRQTKADTAYVTPSHQFPTGVIMPLGRRMELLKWAGEREGRYIIEDDYDSEFRYKGKPIPALQGYDRQGRVIYLGTFSKSIAPAIRLSYMVLPEPVLEEYRKKARFIQSTVSKVDQMIVQRFLEEGYYERHLNKMRAAYKGRHDVLLEEMKALLPVCKVEGEHSGVHILLRFSEGYREEELIRKAREKGIRVYGLSGFYIGKKKETEAVLLLGYATLTEEEIRQAVRRLKDCWKEE